MSERAREEEGGAGPSAEEASPSALTHPRARCRKWVGPGRYEIRYNQLQIDHMARRRLLRYSLQVGRATACCCHGWAAGPGRGSCSSPPPS